MLINRNICHRSLLYLWGKTSQKKSPNIAIHCTSFARWDNRRLLMMRITKQGEMSSSAVCVGVRKSVSRWRTSRVASGRWRREKDEIPGLYLGDLFSEANYHSVSNDIKIMNQRRYKGAGGSELAARLAYASHGGKGEEGWWLKRGVIS